MFSRSLVLTFSFLALQLSLAPAAVTSVDSHGRGARARPGATASGSRLWTSNNDGRITRAGVARNDRSFQNPRLERRRRLSGNEVRAGAQRDTELAADHNPNRFERNLNWTRANFTSLDHNRDSRLSANEWHFDLETFRRVDANRNDSISLQEFLGEGVDDVRDDNFDDMDCNNNGRVERTEWYGGAAEFTRARSQPRRHTEPLRSGRRPGELRHLRSSSQNLDYDRNGTLSRAEWHWSNASFTQRDRNRDGIISRQEFDVAGGAPAGHGNRQRRSRSDHGQLAAPLDRHRHRRSRRRRDHVQRQRHDPR